LQGNSPRRIVLGRILYISGLKSAHFLINYRLGVRPRARMQLSNAAALPPALARAAWRSQSVASALKEFVAGPAPPVAVFALAALPLLGSERGVEACGAQAGNNHSSNKSDFGFIIHPTGFPVDRRKVRFVLATTDLPLFRVYQFRSAKIE